uniref:Uncharacterized protein n=1 Tax=Malurus cyaneus samueli TaxID=2593467 RepID=A0A8C5UC93_9PASS
MGGTRSGTSGWVWGTPRDPRDGFGDPGGDPRDGFGDAQRDPGGWGPGGTLGHGCLGTRRDPRAGARPLPSRGLPAPSGAGAGGAAGGSLPLSGCAGAPDRAVASTVVKQKLAEVILKKQQAALERTRAAPSPRRSLEPLEPEGPSPPMLSTFLPPVPSTSLDPPEHFPLRKTGNGTVPPCPWSPRECPRVLEVSGLSPCPSRCRDRPRVPGALGTVPVVS